MVPLSREFQVFVKPVGPVCNLRCQYCYYLDKNVMYPDSDHFLMSDDILGEYIIQHIEATTDDLITFSWHGGEPLLSGIDFYRKVLKLQSAHKPPGRTIKNGIQTNGTLIDEEWCSFLSENNFIIGISTDGPPEFHNIFRTSKDFSPSWHQVISGFQLLKKHGVIPEVLCVVNAENVSHPLIIYNFFKQLGAKYITFLPLVEPEAGTTSGVSRNSVPAEEFGYFLSTIF